jgi:hypothetical protein
MDCTRQHDATVGALAAALRALLTTSERAAVASNARWQPLADSPNVVYTFDLLTLDRDAEPAWDEPRGCLGSGVQPVTIIDVVCRDGWEEEFYDKPDALALAGVHEYCLWDPSAEVLRPPLQAARLSESAFRPVRTCNQGTFFSDAGFRLTVRGADFTVTPCGRASVEEELFTCRRLLDAALRRADREQNEVDGLTAKVTRLQAKLGGAGP